MTPGATDGEARVGGSDPSVPADPDPIRRLLPESGAVDVAALLAGLGLADRAPDHRPYTIANFVASADGRASVQGQSRGLGSEGDRRIFRGLRGIADALLVGTGTLSAEHYGRVIKDADVRRQRERRGLAPEPALCTVTRTGTLPDGIPLLDEPDARMIVFSGGPVALEGTRAHVEVVRLHPEALTLTAVAEDLRVRHGVRLLLCEGGPTLLHGLLDERIIDELFLTVSPLLAAGDGPDITSGPALPEPLRLALQWALAQDDALFLRYAVAD
ncbi:MAG: dihydrofolate reductase family protein [Solirubrobacteraceae bacterium]